MSSYVQVYVKPNCEKSLNTLDMVSEYGGIDEIVFVEEIDEAMAKYSNDVVRQVNDDDVGILEEFKKEGLELPVVMFDSWKVGYDKLLEDYESGELDSYFT